MPVGSGEEVSFLEKSRRQNAELCSIKVILHEKHFFSFQNGFTRVVTALGQNDEISTGFTDA